MAIRSNRSMVDKREDELDDELEGELVDKQDKQAVHIGSRIEMFVDEWLIEAKRGVSLVMTPPIKKEIVLVLDQSWEGPESGYYSVLQESGKIRLYYRGYCPADDASELQVNCYGESLDGIHFTRPDLGLYEFEGSWANNITWRGVEAHNFSPFKDFNPCSTDGLYKALGGGTVAGTAENAFQNNGVLYAFSSEDGMNWKRMRQEPIMTKGAFDSQNIAFWDPGIGSYRCYSRYFSDNGVRSIQSSVSKDFIEWTGFQPNVYADHIPVEHLYTNATALCPGAEHMYLSFPNRFFEERKKINAHPYDGISDTVFRTSRDGIHWDCSFQEAWCRPGLDPQNWTQRSNMVATGIVQLNPEEFSLYVSEHYSWNCNRLRRISVRRHGFASVYAGASSGEFTTRPLIFIGSQLVLNYATSAAGSIQVELQDEWGSPLPGYTLADMVILYGDELDGVVQWKDGNDISTLQGKPVKMRFVLRDANLYALRTVAAP
ncbi:hypothetical protein [Paenibacillus eucommiae]|uniref:Uncharacterized protein n=1 Tax=Paenibacillus eucommiae TaxID=1355755 RepID=A0ABS4ISK8_9BACL|nr:hypothetical protein [Paenibacillus eucommiae]MBP1990115.1 hypothetical protein [Paenibacillus eucommiae]